MEWAILSRRIRWKLWTTDWRDPATTSKPFPSNESTSFFTLTVDVESCTSIISLKGTLVCGLEYTTHTIHIQNLNMGNGRWLTEAQVYSESYWKKLTFAFQDCVISGSNSQRIQKIYTMNFCARVRAPHEERAHGMDFLQKVHSAFLKVREKTRLNFRIFFTIFFQFKHFLLGTADHTGPPLLQ